MGHHTSRGLAVHPGRHHAPAGCTRVKERSNSWKQLTVPCTLYLGFPEADKSSRETFICEICEFFFAKLSTINNFGCRRDKYLKGRY